MRCWSALQKTFEKMMRGSREDGDRILIGRSSPTVPPLPQTSLSHEVWSYRYFWPRNINSHIRKIKFASARNLGSPRGRGVNCVSRAASTWYAVAKKIEGTEHSRKNRKIAKNWKPGNSGVAANSGNTSYLEKTGHPKKSAAHSESRLHIRSHMNTHSRSHVNAHIGIRSDAHIRSHINCHIQDQIKTYDIQIEIHFTK